MAAHIAWLCGTAVQLGQHLPALQGGDGAFADTTNAGVGVETGKQPWRRYATTPVPPRTSIRAMKRRAYMPTRNVRRSDELQLLTQDDHVVGVRVGLRTRTSRTLTPV